MSEMPKRVCLWRHNSDSSMSVRRADDKFPPFPNETPYVRADVADELLAALADITDQLERIGDMRFHKDGQFIDRARAAIAIAKTQEGTP